MATNVIMPALGMAQETGKVLRWLKADGEAVKQGEPLVEIETDKATVELEAPASGVLVGIAAAPGDVVPVGQMIARILAAGESLSQIARSDSSSPGVGAPATPLEVAPHAAAPPGPPSADSATTRTRPEGGSRRIAASPKARRLAQERGVDLASLAGAVAAGSGPGGAIVAADVIGARPAQSPAPAAEVLPGAPEEPVPMSTTWRLMAERTAQSWSSVPHFILFREVNAGRLVAWREQHQKRFAVEATYSDLFVRLVAAALQRHPRLNARWSNGTVVFNPAINIGLAVAIDEGLVVPVIHGADGLRLAEIAARRIDLVARARAGKLRPDDLSGGTFTISNLGMFAVDGFTAIINTPQAAILAVGRIVQRVVPVDGAPAVRPMLMLSLSCDHRVVDGAGGAQFLETLGDLAENPVEVLG
jgi:pyruvate dehydrogenase E2 component (dihydrolipoamide acetyltransferase)